MEAEQFRLEQLRQVAAHRDRLRQSPRLKYLFFELTDCCNLRCRHCGSRCEPQNARWMDIDQAKQVVDGLARDYPPHSIMICLTGGEPMLHPRFYELAAYIQQAGFAWGMTSNATLIDAQAAKRLRAAGMVSVSVSVDGLAAAHDWLRSMPGAYERCIRGVKAMLNEGLRVQATTVVHRENYAQLEAIYESMLALGVYSWRPINIDPIGRAGDARDLLLTDEQLIGLLDFIRDKRFHGDPRMEVTYGCSHYVTPTYEHMVRDSYFLCVAGLSVAGILVNGDMVACLDIERRPELVQGRMGVDDFGEVWRERYQIFRRDRTEDCELCRGCPDRYVCGGDSLHTWDFDAKQPMICVRNARLKEGR